MKYSKSQIMVFIPYAFAAHSLISAALLSAGMLRLGSEAVPGFTTLGLAVQLLFTGAAGAIAGVAAARGLAMRASWSWPLAIVLAVYKLASPVFLLSLAELWLLLQIDVRKTYVAKLRETFLDDSSCQNPVPK